MTCRQCDDLGFYYDRDKVTSGRFGKFTLCPCVGRLCRCGGIAPYQYFDGSLQPCWCPCYRYRRDIQSVERLINDADVPAKYRWKFLDDFHMTGRDGSPIPGAPHLKAIVLALVERRARGEQARGFLFHGIPGTGKTLMACIALTEMIVRCRKPGKFLDLSFNYFQKLRSTYNGKSGMYGKTWEIIDQLTTVPFLVIDDFGVQRNTEWEIEMLYNLVDARYEEERVTLITTNKRLDDIRPLADGRIYSRLIEMCYIVQFQGPDYRVSFSKML